MSGSTMQLECPPAPTVTKAWAGPSCITLGMLGRARRWRGVGLGQAGRLGAGSWYGLRGLFGWPFGPF